MRIMLCLVISMLVITDIMGNTSSVSISGKVVGDKNEPVSVGNVLILSPSDSSMITGDVIIDGTFSISGVEEKVFILEISALGYVVHRELIDNSDGQTDIDVGTIKLEIMLIDVVEVVSRRPLFEKRGDNVVVNIEGTSLSSSGTILDVLGKSPKVALNSDNEASVLGKGKALIYLDGQLIPSNEILNNLSSNDIKEIEIIENPSAKYDAEGKAIISIITKTKTIDGFKLGVIQELEKRSFFRHYHKVHSYFRASDFMCQASYGIRKLDRLGTFEYTRSYQVKNDEIEVENDIYDVHDMLTHDYSLRLSYAFSPGSKLGFQYSGFYTDADKDADNDNIFYNNNDTSFNLTANARGPYSKQSSIANLSYDLSLDTLGSNLFVSGQYSGFNLDSRENITQVVSVKDVESNSLDKRSNNVSDIDVFTGQLDYVKAFSKGVKLSSGAKNAYITNSSKFIFEGKKPDGVYEVDPYYNNQFSYNENVLGVYGEVAVNKNSIRTTAGIRGEWTETSGVSESLEYPPIDTSYFNVFPSCAIGKKFGNVDVNLSYNSRIQRPKFKDLNPFVIYIDSLYAQKGNPGLTPEYSHSISSSISIKSLSFDIGYTRVRDRINAIIESRLVDGELVNFFLQWDNFESSDLWSASVTYPLSRKWWSSYNVMGVRQDAFRFREKGAISINKKPNFYLYTNHTFQLIHDVKLELSFNYISSRVDGIGTDNAIYNLGGAVSRKFWNNHLMVRLQANDVLDSFKFVGVGNYEGYRLDYLVDFDLPFVKLSLNWDFGKLGGSLRKKSISDDEVQRINQ